MIFRFFAYGTIFLLATVLLLSAWVIAQNLYSQHRERLLQARRSRLRQELLAYLASKLNLEQLLPTLNNTAELLTGVLSQVSTQLSFEEKEKLLVLLNEPSMNAIIKRELKNLTSWHCRLRQQAATYLPYLCTTEKISGLLLMALSDRREEVKIAAAISLAQLQSINATTHIITCLAQVKTLPGSRVVEIILIMGEKAKESLLGILKDKQSTDEALSITIACLAGLKVTEASECIQGFSKEPDKNLRIQTMKALGVLHQPSALGVLLEGLQDSEWEVRAICAKGLGNFQEADAIPALEKYLGDPSYWVRFNCAQALSEHGTQGLSVLAKNLKSQDRFIRDVCTQMIQTAEMQATLAKEISL